MGNCSSKDGVRDDETAPLPQANTPVASPKSAPNTTITTTNTTSKPAPVLNISAPLKEWSTHDIQIWLRTLPPHLVCYSPILMGPGVKVQEWNDQALTDLGVKNEAHRQDLFKQRQQLLVEISSAMTVNQKAWEPTAVAAASAISKDAYPTRALKACSSTEDLLSKRGQPNPVFPSVPSPVPNDAFLSSSGCPPSLNSSVALASGSACQPSPSPEILSPNGSLSVAEAYCPTDLLEISALQQLPSPGRKREISSLEPALSSGGKEGSPLEAAVGSVLDSGSKYNGTNNCDGSSFLKEREVERQNGYFNSGTWGDVKLPSNSAAEKLQVGEIGRSEAWNGPCGTATAAREGLSGLDAILDKGQLSQCRDKDRDNLAPQDSRQWDGQHNGGYNPRVGRDPSGNRNYRDSRDRKDSRDPRNGNWEDGVNRHRSFPIDGVASFYPGGGVSPGTWPERLSYEPRRQRDYENERPSPHSRGCRSPEQRSRQEWLSCEPQSQQERLSPDPRSHCEPSSFVSPSLMVSPDISPGRTPGLDLHHQPDRLSHEPHDLPNLLAPSLRNHRAHPSPEHREPSLCGLGRNDSDPPGDSNMSVDEQPKLGQLGLPRGYPPEYSIGHTPDRRQSLFRDQPNTRLPPTAHDTSLSLNYVTDSPLHMSDQPLLTALPRVSVRGEHNGMMQLDCSPAEGWNLDADQPGLVPSGIGGLNSSLDHSDSPRAVAGCNEYSAPYSSNLPTQPDLTCINVHLAQSLASSAVQGQAVCLLGMVENSRQRWDEESRHVEALLRHSAGVLPAPGVQLSSRLRGMYGQLDHLMLNQVHYRKLFERTLSLMALLCELLTGTPVMHSRWRNYAARLADILMAIEEYMTPVSGKAWLGVLVTGGWSSDLMQAWWRQLADLAVEVAAEGVTKSQPVEECLTRFSTNCKFDDESSKMKNLISALGGIAVVMGEPKKTLELCAMLNTRKRHQKLTVNQVLQAALLMECTVEIGPHSIITNDSMRMLWYRCFPNRHHASWAEFWKVFPGVLPDLGVDMVEVEALNNTFKLVQCIHNLQRHICNGTSNVVTVFHIRETFPRYMSLREACIHTSDEFRSTADAVIDAVPTPGLFGRQKDLAVLMTSLAEVWRPGIVVLQGGTGRGKSSLLHEAAGRLRRGDFCSGALVMVDMHNSATASELAAMLCASLGAVLEGEDKTAMWVALQRLSVSGPTLLMMENVTAAVSDQDGKVALSSLLQQILSKNPNTRVLLTSNVVVELPGLQIEHHNLAELSAEGAMALLHDSIPELDKEVGLYLSHICKFQPLSLNLAAACLAHGHCSTSDIGNLHTEHNTPTASSNPEAGVLRAVLSVMPQPLVDALTHLVIFPQHFDDRAAALVLRRDVPDARGVLAALCSRHLLQVSPTNGCYRMHPAVRDVATKQLCPSGYPHPAISGFLVSCLEMLRSAGSMYKQCHCTTALQWLNQQRRNLLALLNLLNSGVLSETLVNQVEDLAQGIEVMTALDIGNPRMFAKMWYILSIGVERVLTPTHPNLATVLCCRADVLAKMQHFVEAEKLYKQAMHIISKVPGGAEPQFASVLEKLGVLLSKQGSYEQASHHLRRALNIKQKIMSDDSIEVAVARIKLASTLSQKDVDSEEAEQLLTDGYATMVADVAQGNYHPRVLEPFTNLAASYMAQDLHSEAERMYRCILQVQEELIDNQDPRLVGTLRKLAAACACQSKLDDAECLYTRALQIQQHYYGQGQLESVPVMNKLAAIHSLKGQLNAAEAIFNNSLSIQRQHQGENHADLAPTLCELGDLLCKQSKWAKAELAYKEALQVLKTVIAEEKIFARVLVRLATAVEAQDRPKEAQVLYEQLISLQRKVVGENSHQVADAYQKMGGVLQQQGDTTHAQRMTEKCVAILQQLVGDTPRLAEALKVLGMQMSANGLHEEAEQKLRHAITIETQAYGPNNLRLTDGLLRLAEVMQKLGKLNDAEEATSWVIDINLQGATPSECNNPGIAKLYVNLAGIQQAQGKLADAVLSLQRALAIYDRLVARLVAQPAAWRTDELVIKIADLLSENGQYGQAEGYYARAVSEQEATQGGGSLDLATSIFKLALAQSAQSKHSEAEQLYQRALNIRQKAMGTKNPELLPILSGLAMARGAQGDWPSAERLYFQALQIFETQDGINHADVASVIDHLHEALENQGKITELGQLYARVRNIDATVGSSHDAKKLLDDSQKYPSMDVNMDQRAKI